MQSWKETIASSYWEKYSSKCERIVSDNWRFTLFTVSRYYGALKKVEKLNKWAPCELKEHQKLRRFEVCSMLCVRNTNKSFLDRIVTCNKKWILYDNFKQSGQCLDRDESSKHFSKPKFLPKMIIYSYHEYQ